MKTIKLKKLFLVLILLTMSKMVCNPESEKNIKFSIKKQVRILFSCKNYLIPAISFVGAGLFWLSYKCLKCKPEKLEPKFIKEKNGNVQSCLKKNYDKSLKPKKGILKKPGNDKGKSRSVKFDLESNECCFMQKKDNEIYRKFGKYMLMNSNFPNSSSSNQTTCLGKVLKKGEE